MIKTYEEYLKEMKNAEYLLTQEDWNKYVDKRNNRTCKNCKLYLDKDDLCMSANRNDWLNKSNTWGKASHNDKRCRYFMKRPISDASTEK